MLMRILSLLSKVGVSFALLVTLTGCSMTDLGHDYSDFADEPGERLHWIRVFDLGVVSYARIDAILINERDIEEHELTRVSGAELEDQEKLSLLASPRARRVIEASGIGADLHSLLERYFGRLMSRSYVPDKLPAFEIILLREDEGMSITRRTLGVSQARVPVLLQLDTSSAQSMIISLARQAPIIGHEVVHLSGHGGGLSFPGPNPEASMLNEEIFASLVESCDRFDNLLRLELGGRKRIELHKVPSDYPGDADAHFRELRRAGPSPAGKFIAGMIVHEGLPTGVPLDASEQELIMDRCARRVEQPEAYLEKYSAEGLPDRWDRYLVPSDQYSERSAD